MGMFDLWSTEPKSYTVKELEKMARINYLSMNQELIDHNINKTINKGKESLIDQIFIVKNPDFFRSYDLAYANMEIMEEVIKLMEISKKKNTKKDILLNKIKIKREKRAKTRKATKRV